MASTLTSLRGQSQSKTPGWTDGASPSKTVRSFLGQLLVVGCGVTGAAD